MFKKSKFLILLPILLLVTLVTGGFSYYLFNTSSNVTSLDNVGTGSTTNESRNDKIYENYSFSDTGSGNEYTFYFFPSTLYLELYNQGYTNPENVFGYNELVFDDNGNPQVNAEGEPVYEVKKEETQSINVNSYTLIRESRTSYPEWNVWDVQWDYFWHDWSTEQPIESKIPEGYNFNSSDGYYYFGNEDGNRTPTGRNQTQTRYWVVKKPGDYSTYYDYMVGALNGDSSYYYKDGNGAAITLNDNYYTRQNGGYENEVLSPTTDEKDVYDLGLSHPDQNIDPNNDIYMGRRQYRNDRFGFWPTLYDQDDPHNTKGNFDGKGSRYLPIKITVNGNLTADLYDLAIPTPLSSTYVNSSGWFNYFFSLWTYVTDKNNPPYQTAIQGLYGRSQANIFDIMRNPSLYADKNNVIRLYPYFTRGNGNAPGEENNTDNILAQYTYGQVDRMDSLISETPFTYQSETLTYGNGDTLNYSVLNNIYLETNKYSDISFRIDTTRDSSHNGHNVLSHKLSQSSLNKIVSDFGEGTYNFYMFVRNAGRDFTNYYVNWLNKDINNKADNIREILVGTASEEERQQLFTGTSTYFTSLYRKNLFYVSTDSNGNNWEDELKYLDTKGDSAGGSSRIISNKPDEYDPNTGKLLKDNTGNHGTVNYRAVLLMFEKVSNFKVVEDIPFPELTEKENEKNSYTGDFYWDDDIDSAISTIYDHSKNMILANGVYEINSETFKNEKFTLNGQTNLSIENPFIYVIQNCDFRYVDSLFFQIRVGNDYIRQAINIVTNFNEETVPKYLAYRSGRDKNNNPIYSYFASQSALFNNEDEFFIQNADVTDQDGKGDTRNGLKLKDNYARGVYDLMLVPTGSRTPGKPIDCNLYIYRHRVDFIKIMDKEPGLTRFDASGNSLGGDFVNHYGAGENPAKTIWESSFYIGDTFNSSSASDASGTVLEALTKYSNDNGIDNFALKDSVTGEAIAYYRNGILYGPSGNSSNGNDVELFTILKNYVLYVE